MTGAEGPDQTKIALLEHELLGIEPEPGSPAARTLGKRRREAQAQASCEHDDVLTFRPLGEARPRGICHRCGADMVEDAQGEWTPQ